MASRCWNGIMVSLLMCVVVLAGCAKRPAMTAASAPAPTGAAQATTPSPSASASSSPSSSAPQATASAPATGPASTAAPARTPVQEFAATPNLKDIHFDFDKYDIRPGDANTLDANAAWLKGNDALVLVEGHCDERGTNEYNLALGERRAKVTMNYLVSRGVQVGRITIISYGEERPVCTEHNDACWATNRRAHFLAKSR